MARKEHNPKTNMTLAKLAALMESGFVQAKKDNEDLAIMVQQGFAEAKADNEERFVALEQGQTKLEQEMQKLQQGQEDIKMRMNNVAYRIDVVDLQKRMQRVEDIVLRKKK